jgi:hypothetical protein
MALIRVKPNRLLKGLGFERYKNPLHPARSAEIVIAPKTTKRRKAYEYGRAS